MEGMERLLELLQDAETPLYSAYRFVRREVAPQMSLVDFLSHIDSMMKRDVVRLWSISDDQRRRVDSVSPDLALQYGTIEGLEDSYDPFGYSLTLGENAPHFSESPWKFEMNMEVRTFLWEGPPESLDEALRQLHAIHSGYRFEIQDREMQGTLAKVRGRIIDRA